MTEKVVLDLPETIVEKAREESERTGNSFEAVLIDWLERSAANADVYPLVANTEYIIETPYANESAAKALLDLLKRSD